MRLLIFAIFLSALCSTSFGQPNDRSLFSLNDSLRNELKRSQADSLKAEILMRIAENLLFSDPDSTIYYGEKALNLAEKVNDVLIQIGAIGFIGNALIYKGNLPKALELGFKAIEMAKDYPIRVQGIGPTYDNMGRIYFLIGDYDKAFQYFKKMAAFGEADIVGVAYGYFNMAMVYEKINILDSAMICLEKSFQTFSTIKYSIYQNVYDFYPGWYNLRGRVYLKQNKPDDALHDYFTTLRMTIKNGQVYHTSNTYNEISAYYKKFIQTDSAIYYAEKGLAEANKISYTQGILNASEILAEQYELKDPQKALYYFKLSTDTRNKLYGAGNMQILRDMISQEEERKKEIEAAKVDYQNRLRMNALLGSTFTLIIIAVFLFRNNRQKQKAKKKIEEAYDQLKSTQSQLIQSEKMASLGELTAGIAHEIQNPLNFVNNFSEVNKELISELKEEAKKGDIEEVQALADDIALNEEKIIHHGKRADSIVKGMLQHSRTSEGVKEKTDINALAEEYLRLAYHGLRAKDKSFNATFNLELDKNLPKIKVIPQEIGRVLLNLINNAFYASSSKASLSQSKGATEDSNFKPMVEVSTKKLEGKVEIRVKDNGPGIPESIRDKIFQPFFTTKPAGQGTGLGLSLSYDIIKAHGGEIRVESNDIDGGSVQALTKTGTEFIIEIPIAS
jgi:signal transduction histidine kinase